jgi:cytochrome bd-type quinol oxidase subunit 2
LGSLIAEEARSTTDVFGLFVALLVAALLAAVLLGTNYGRIKQGESLRSPAATAVAIAVLVAALVMLMVTVNLDIRWGMAMSILSIAVTWGYLTAMLARGVPREADDELADYGDPTGDRPRKHGASWLEISAQIAGILSLVVSVIALLKD